MRVLLTNDDGIQAEGLRRLRRALLEIVEDIDLVVVAPDSNRSATARSITTRRSLWVREVRFADDTVGYAADGMPVDCVRLANLGLVRYWQPELVVSGINHGANLGDDITYSGTVAAALEGILLGIPAIAVSQQSLALEEGFDHQEAFYFGACATFIAKLVNELANVPLPEATLLNVNFPGRPPHGVRVARLGRRIYRDELKLEQETPERGREYRIYGDAASDPDDTDTDTAAVAAGYVALTPVHFDLTHHSSLDVLAAHDLQRLLHESAG